MRHSHATWFAPALVGLVLFISAPPAHAYSVLTHEAIVDSAWDDGIRPILVRRFGSSAEALRRARAFAYGGCIIQDMGYYPLSSRTFGDFVHYVRSGDFVSSMIAQARDMNELAFALGALAHYTADNVGHPLAINRSVPLLFPKLAAKYGSPITYEEDKAAHLRTEFGFDVLQVSKGRYLPEAYHDFIGFQVSKPLLERAFKATYGLELKDVFGNIDVSIGTFRWAVGSLLPALTNAAWSAKQKDLQRADPSVTRQTFVFAYSRREFEDAWGTDYKRPNFGHRMLAVLIRILPKVGPLKSLALKAPTPEAERLFVSSFNTVVAEYRTRLAAAGRGTLTLPDRNFDTGELVRAGDYRLVDEAFAELVKRLADRQFADVTPALRARLLDFYRDPNAPLATREDRHDWQELGVNLARLRATRVAAR